MNKIVLSVEGLTKIYSSKQKQNLALNDITGHSARLPIIIPEFPIENIIEDPDFWKSSMLFMFQGDIP